MFFGLFSPYKTEQRLKARQATSESLLTLLVLAVGFTLALPAPLAGAGCRMVTDAHVTYVGDDQVTLLINGNIIMGCSHPPTACWQFIQNSVITPAMLVVFTKLCPV